jgi:hypothetical protein
VPLPVGGKRREREPLACLRDHRRVEVEAEEVAEPPHHRVGIGDEVLEPKGGHVRDRPRVGERGPVRVPPVLGREPQLLLGRERDEVRRPLAPHGPVAPAVRVADDEDEERVAAFEVGGEQRHLERVRVRLVEEAHPARVAGVDEEVLAQEAPVAAAVRRGRVPRRAPVERQERVAGVDAVVVRAEERMPEIVRELAAPERPRQPRYPVPHDAELVDAGPVRGVSGHAHDGVVAAHAAADDRPPAALHAEEEDRPVERHAVDRGEAAPERVAPVVAPVEADRLDRHVAGARARGAAGRRKEVRESGEMAGHGGCEPSS